MPASRSPNVSRFASPPTYQPGGVLAHPTLEERHGVCLPVALGGLTIPAPIDVIVDPPDLEQVLRVLGVAVLFGGVPSSWKEWWCD
jgi:hypothetical protein